MNYEPKAWAEAKGACLRNFNEQGDIDSVNGALASILRKNWKAY